MWYSLVLIWACAANPASVHGMSNPDPKAIGCDSKGLWGYTDPLLDFQTLIDCNTAGHRFQTQQPHTYIAWRCVSDPNKEPWADAKENQKRP